MTRHQSSVNIDTGLVKRALKRAKEKNLPKTLRGLLDYLINAYTKDLMPIDFDPHTFLWVADKRTSMTYEKDSIKKIQDTLLEKCLPTGYDFIVSLLLTNFLKNTD